MKRLSIVAASLAFAASSFAAPTPLTFSDAGALTTTEISQTLNLSQFDGSLGTLLGATLTFGSQGVFDMTGTNNSANGTSARINATSDIVWSLGGALNPFLFGQALSATTGVQAYAGNQTRAFGPFDSTASDTVDLATILGQLTGNGNFTLQCDSLSGFGVIGGAGNIVAGQTTKAACNASITYIYEPTASVPVPEPTSLALVGLALAAAGFTAVRRKA